MIATDRTLALRVAETCPDCRDPLVVREQPNKERMISCRSCAFTEQYDERAVRLMQRILHLQRQLTLSDANAPLWEPRPESEPEPTQATQRKLSL